jgi:hypothetical protein
MTTRYTGIIRCLPSCEGATIGARKMRLSLAYLESGIIDSIYIALNAKPRIEIPHMYLAVGGKVHARLNIASYEPGDRRKCWDDQYRQPKLWAVCTAPVLRPPQPFNLRGFQGFRYTEGTMGAILADQPDLWRWADEVGATEIERYIVWLLKQASGERPVGIAQIQSWVKQELHEVIAGRSIKDYIRTLRREHGMPVLARRGTPSGYYLCKSRDEMKKFCEAYLSQARDEMETVRKILRNNYPSLLSEFELGSTHEEIAGTE